MPWDILNGILRHTTMGKCAHGYSLSWSNKLCYIFNLQIVLIPQSIIMPREQITRTSQEPGGSSLVICSSQKQITKNHKNREVPSASVLFGAKLNSERYIADILEDCLLPWAKKHVQGVPRFLQQDSAPSHASKITQFGIRRKIPWFISKKVWPASSPDFNPLDFFIWSILETKACSSNHSTVQALKAKLVKK